MFFINIKSYTSLTTGHLQKETYQRCIDIIVAAPGLMFSKHALLRQLVEIFGCRLTHDAQISLDILNFRVGMPEQIVQQFLTVYSGEFRTHPMFHGCHLFPHPLNQLQGNPGRPGHGTLKKIIHYYLNM